MSRIIIGILFIAIILIVNVLTSAKVLAEQESTSSSEIDSKMSSYELFWPLLAGKTLDDSFYFLKLIKEDIRGLFIFGNVQKADYKIMLSTKRVLEAEKLLQTNKEELAVQTLDKAFSSLSSAKINLSKAEQTNIDFQQVRTNIIKQLSNLNSFLPELSLKSQGDAKTKVDGLNEAVQQILINLP